MISRIDNLSFLAAVKNISQSASCVCKLLPAGDSSQFAMGGTGLWQASSQYGNGAVWQQGYQIVAVHLYSVPRMPAPAEMGSGPVGRARHPGERGEEDTRGKAEGGVRRAVRKQEEDLSGETDRNRSWETVRVAGRKDSSPLAQYQDCRAAILQTPCKTESQLRSNSQQRARPSAFASLRELRFLELCRLFYLLVE